MKRTLRQLENEKEQTNIFKENFSESFEKLKKKLEKRGKKLEEIREDLLEKDKEIKLLTAKTEYFSKNVMEEKSLNLAKDSKINELEDNKSSLEFQIEKLNYEVKKRRSKYTSEE